MSQTTCLHPIPYVWSQCEIHECNENLLCPAVPEAQSRNLQCLSKLLHCLAGSGDFFFSASKFEVESLVLHVMRTPVHTIAST